MLKLNVYYKIKLKKNLNIGRLLFISKRKYIAGKAMKNIVLEKSRSILGIKKIHLFGQKRLLHFMINGIGDVK